jgi:hypothetical protein
VLC